MERREVLRLVSLATGAAISAPLLGSLLSSCKTDIKKDDLDYALQFFSKEEFAKIKSLVNTILPKTDSPSATDVGVHQVIDTMVGNVYSERRQKSYTERFNALVSYLDTSSENELAALQNLSKSSENEDAKRAFLNLKQQTIAYYLTTEEIGKNYLNYLPVPGEYEPCISLEEVGGKAWAL